MLTTPWLCREESCDMISMVNTGSEKFTLDLCAVKVGYHREYQYNTPLKHGIPFVPSSTLIVCKEDIVKLTTKELVLRIKSDSIQFGLVTDMEIVWTYVSANITNVRVKVKITVNGKLIPKGNSLNLAIAESKAIENMKKVYGGWVMLLNSGSRIDDLKPMKKVSKPAASKSEFPIALFCVFLFLLLLILCINMYTLNTTLTSMQASQLEWVKILEQLKA